MPRVTHVMKARKDNDICKAGESYYWWKFRFGGKRLSLTYPRQSQLTQSEFLSGIYSIQEEAEDWSPDDEKQWHDELESAVEDWKSQVEELGETCTENRENMPEALQDGDTGAMLAERAENCESMVNELDGLSFDEPDDDMEDDEITDAWQNGRDEAATALSYEGE